MLKRLVIDQSGQDLIEYALLTSIIGVAGVLVFSTFAGKMEDAYNTWNTDSQTVWEPCPPIGLGGCP